MSSQYNQIYNADDSVIRHIIIGFLADLNNKVYFYRQLDENNRVIIDVPFYYSITGDDEFLRDNFLFQTATGPNCVPHPTFVDGNYDVIPRGVAMLQSISIDASKLVNRRTRGSYSRLDSTGSMQTYTAEFEMIPITLSFNLEILVSSQLDALKITEMLIKKMYKSNYFYTEVGHLNEGTYKIASYYSLPDDFEIEKPIEFTFDSKTKTKINIAIELNTFMPSFDLGDEITIQDPLGNGNIIRNYNPNGANTTELHAGTRMFELQSTTSNKNPFGYIRGSELDDVRNIKK